MSSIILALITSLTLMGPSANVLQTGMPAAPAAIQHQHGSDKDTAGCPHCKDAKHAEGMSCCKDGKCEGCGAKKSDGSQADKQMACGDCCKADKDGKGCCGDSCKMGKDKGSKQAGAGHHCAMMGR